jgi:Uma2 family endonuclease
MTSRFYAIDRHAQIHTANQQCPEMTMTFIDETIDEARSQTQSPTQSQPQPQTKSKARSKTKSPDLKKTSQETPLTLTEFLELPETKPASDFLHGEMTQKPIPKGEHSWLQAKICETVNAAVEPQKIALAFPELRCTFGGGSIIPDVSVFRWERIPRKGSGRIAADFKIPPDWAIEILSSGQSATQVLEKLFHCIAHGTELGWLLDPQEDSIWTVFPGQRVQILKGKAKLTVLEGIPLQLTAKQVFDWLLI